MVGLVWGVDLPPLTERFCSTVCPAEQCKILWPFCFRDRQTEKSATEHIRMMLMSGIIVSRTRTNGVFHVALPTTGNKGKCGDLTFLLYAMRWSLEMIVVSQSEQNLICFSVFVLTENTFPCAYVVLVHLYDNEASTRRERTKFFEPVFVTLVHALFVLWLHLCLCLHHMWTAAQTGNFSNKFSWQV